MAIDPTIALNAKAPQTQNLLAQYGDVAQTGNAILQGQQLRLQRMGQNALARAYQSAPIDPQTGLPDSRQIISNLQNMPGGGYVLPQAIQNFQKQQQAGYEIRKAQLDQTTARTNAVNNSLAPLMRMGSNVSPQDVFSTISGLHAAGFPTDEFVQDAATTLPVKAPGMSDAQYGQQLQGWIVNHAARTWPAAVQADKFAPNVATVDTGGNILTRDVNPYTNPGITSAPPIGKTLSPNEQLNPMTTTPGPNGEKRTIPAGAYAQQQGMGNLVPGGAPGGASPFANGGRFPSALLNPSRPANAPAPGTPAQVSAPASPSGSGGAMSPAYAPTAAPSMGLKPAAPGVSQSAAPPAPGAPMVTELGAGQSAGLQAAGDASAKQWGALQSSVGGSAGRIYQLQSALGDLQSLGTTGTGPSSGTLNNIKSYLQSVPVIGQQLGIDPSGVANYDEANKYLTAYAAARASRFGGGTDQQLATTLSSNASTHISNLASQDVVKANIGLERMDQAQLAGFQNGLDPATGQPTGQKFTPDQFSDYASRWNTANDARAFVADKLSPQQFTTMLAGMSPGDQTRFRNSFNSGISQGFIDPPSWMQSGAPGQSGQPAPAASAAGPPAPAPAVAQPPPLTVSGPGQPAAAGGF